MYHFFDTIQDQEGRPVSGASYTLLNYPALTTATLYASNGVTTVTNPMTSDSAGGVSCYLIGGAYARRITVNGVLQTAANVDDIQIADSANQTYTPAGPSALATTVQANLRTQAVSIADKTGNDPTGAADSSAAMAACVTTLGTYGTIYLPPGTWAFNVDLAGTRINIEGAGIGKTFIKSFAAAQAPIIFGSTAGWEIPVISKCSIVGDGGTRTKLGLQFGHTIYQTNDEFAGRIYIRDVLFKDLDKSIVRLYGNIGLYCENVTFENSNYHVWSKGQVSPTMHSGVVSIKNGHMQGAQLACFYIEPPAGESM